MNKLLEMQKNQHKAGLGVTSHLLAGKPIKGAKVPRLFSSINDFNFDFAGNLMPGCKIEDLSAALNLTNEKCKQAGGGNKCDKWADTFGIPFAKG